MSELPAAMALIHRQQIRSLLPFTPVNHVVADLVYATRDASGTLVMAQPVQNRPWEWVEYLGEPADAESDRSTVKNSTSISLELFEARGTSDSIVDNALDARTRATIHTFQDGLAGDGLFQRDWREARLEPVETVLPTFVRLRTEEADVLSALPTFPRVPSQGRAGSQPLSRDASPMSATLSRGSWAPHFPGSAPPSVRMSPMQPSLNRASVSTTTSTDDGIVGAGGRRTSKRKAQQAVIDVDDDDIQIIDPPPAPSGSTAGKKLKGKTSAKTKAGKR
jgi:mediator of RNA polymerase II transcription subunit 12